MFKEGEQFIQMFTVGRDSEDLYGLTNKGRIFLRESGNRYTTYVWIEQNVPEMEPAVDEDYIPF